jgi:predicted DNA-binding transcriptional regulator AlpA
MEGVHMKVPERPPSYMSCAELAWELSISQSTVLEMVRRKVLPEPVRLSGGQFPMHRHIEVSLIGANRYSHKRIEVFS